jgi:hypothetical protein
MLLSWKVEGRSQEATIGKFEEGDGVRFTLSYYPTCYRRGPFRLLVEVAGGVNHLKWGCFDDQDQPMRWYHLEASAKTEANEIAQVLLNDRSKVS